MQAALQAVDITKAGVLPAFDRVRGYCFLTLICIASGIPSLTLADKELSFLDLEELVETCVEQTDLNFENRSALPINIQNSMFSEVRVGDANRLEEASKLQIANLFLKWVFEPDASDEHHQETLNAIPRLIEHDQALSRHHERVLRQIGAHALWKNPSPEAGEWNDYGIIGGSAWWYDEDIAVIWKGGTSLFRIGLVCEIYGVPADAALELVRDSDWNFEIETRGPVARYSASKRSITPLSRTLVRMLTGIGKKHKLPNAEIEVFQFEHGFLRGGEADEWVIIISEDRGT